MPQYSLWTKYQRFTSFLVDKTFFLAMICLLGMIVPVVIDVILRTFTSWSLPGTVELEELFMLMLVFLSLAEPQLKQRHIEMDLFFPHFPKPMQRGLMVFHWLVCLILILVLTYEVGVISLERFETKQFSEVLAIPHWPFFFIATLGMLLMCLTLVDSLGTAVLDCLKNRSFLAMLAALAGSGLLCSLPWLLEDTPFAWDFLLAGGCGFLLLMLLLIGRMPIGYAMAAVGTLGLMLIKVFEETIGEVMSMAMADAIMEGTAEDIEALKKEGHEFIVMSEQERAKCFDQLMPVLKAGWLEELGSQPRVADPDALYRKAQNLVNKYSDMERQREGK